MSQKPLILDEQIPPMSVKKFYQLLRLYCRTAGCIIAPPNFQNIRADIPIWGKVTRREEPEVDPASEKILETLGVQGVFNHENNFGYLKPNIGTVIFLQPVSRVKIFIEEWIIKPDIDSELAGYRNRLSRDPYELLRELGWWLLSETKGREFANNWFEELEENSPISEVGEESWKKTLAGTDLNHIKVVELWRQNYSAKEISKKVWMKPETILNLISVYRKEFGSDIVPYDEDRKKIARKKIKKR